MSGAATEVLVGAIAAVPGIYGTYYAFRVRRQQKASTVTQFGTTLAETAFKTLEAQVTRLVADQAHFDEDRTRWDQDREVWSTDRMAFVVKANELQAGLRVTNTYVQMLLSMLDNAGIARPAPPPGYEILTAGLSPA